MQTTDPIPVVPTDINSKGSQYRQIDEGKIPSNDPIDDTVLMSQQGLQVKTVSTDQPTAPVAVVATLTTNPNFQIKNTIAFTMGLIQGLVGNSASDKYFILHLPLLLTSTISADDIPSLDILTKQRQTFFSILGKYGMIHYHTRDDQTVNNGPTQNIAKNLADPDLHQQSAEEYNAKVAVEVGSEKHNTHGDLILTVLKDYFRTLGTNGDASDLHTLFILLEQQFRTVSLTHVNLTSQINRVITAISMEIDHVSNQLIGAMKDLTIGGLSTVEHNRLQKIQHAIVMFIHSFEAVPPITDLQSGTDASTSRNISHQSLRYFYNIGCNFGMLANSIISTGVSAIPYHSITDAEILVKDTQSPALTSADIHYTLNVLKSVIFPLG